MMTLFDNLTQNAWLLAFVGAHFIVYSIPAWIVIVVRLARRRLTFAERMILLSFLLSVLLEIVQLSVSNNRFSGKEIIWGYSRYFGTLGPLLWVWTALLLAAAWQMGQGMMRWAVRAVVVAALALLFYHQNICFFHDQFTDSPMQASWDAARRIAPVIRADWKGPRKTSGFRYMAKDFYSARRPIVFSNLGAAAWEAGGSCEGVHHGARPGLKEDYLFARVGVGYYGVTQFSKAEYSFVTNISGAFGDWVLLRRKQGLSAGTESKK